MTKTIITVLFLLTSFQVVLSQQFNFAELIKISKSQKDFEQKMYAIGNDLVDFETQDITYTYTTNSGGNGCSLLIPTSDTNMLRKFQFSNGEILTESQVGRQFGEEQRNALIKSKEMTLVKGPESNYIYIPDLKTFSIGTTTISKFAENYDRKDAVANTFYNHRLTKNTDNEGRGIITYYKSLNIQYNRDSDYKNTLKQIQSVAKYIETRKLLEFLYVDFTYRDTQINKECKITCTPSNDGHGGTIQFTWYDLKK